MGSDWFVHYGYLLVDNDGVMRVGTGQNAISGEGSVVMHFSEHFFHGRQAIDLIKNEVANTPVVKNALLREKFLKVTIRNFIRLSAEEVECFK